MGLTVNGQMAKKLTVNRQKRNIFTVNRQISAIAVRLLLPSMTSSIDHFTVVCSVTWPLNGSWAAGDLLLIQTSLLLLYKSGCYNAN